jgi:hypothetical protein
LNTAAGVSTTTVAIDWPVRYQTRNANSESAPTSQSAFLPTLSLRYSRPLPSM